MKLPSVEEYLQIIEKKDPGNLSTLYNHRFFINENSKTYLFHRSRRNILFKTEHQSKFYAVRFFLNDDDALFRRYHQIQAYLNAKELSWKVPFRFMNEEYYPAILMDWIDGISLTQYLDLIIETPSLLSKLQEKLISLSQELERNKIGHGNLNMKHIRFVKERGDYVLKLIDYDSMYIPDFEGKDSISSGTAGFQHPMRLTSDFSETVDRFSFWILITALEAFKIDPQLWINSKQYGFNKEEQVFFTYRDLAFSNTSTAFQLLRGYNDKALKYYTEKLSQFCSSTSLSDINQPQLYTERSNYPNTVDKEPVVVNKPERVATPVIEKKVVQPTKIAAETPTVVERQAGNKERSKLRDNGLAYVKAKEEEKKVYTPREQKKKAPVSIIITVALAVVCICGYFIWNSLSKKKVSEIVPVQNTVAKTQPEQTEVKSVFTSASTTQFLFQLYQAYNKRDLPAILSNYADNLTQYYDAGAISKSKLGDIVRDLFIKPAYYECHPDIRTLDFRPDGNTCKLTVAITETIKATKRSKPENYSSKVEYLLNNDFKIVAEKNIE